MTMKYYLMALLIVLVAGLHTVSAASDKSVQHIELADIDSFDEAKQVFSETTSQLQEKAKLDAVELQNIHIITYSLEKAVAYFVENMQGEQQIAATKMAELVELIHIGSENNRPVKVDLEAYFKLAETFSVQF